METLTLYVPIMPSIGGIPNIARGSAIVGGPLRDDHGVIVYYEGNVYDSQDSRTYEVRVNIAAGRYATKAPTIAKASVPPQYLIAVGIAGHIKHHGWIVREITDASMLQAWLDSEPLPPLNGSADFRTRAVGKAFRGIRPAQMLRYQATAQATGRSITDVIFDDILAETLKA